MSSDKTKANFLKYLEMEHTKFLAIPDLSNVITMDCKMGKTLFTIWNDYKNGKLLFKVDENPTYQV